ncbi:MAG: PilZ domain-containing protein [Erythrobacter sp.]|uniref:PilZ domain-containing protein n=1 Tax=Erythrobacter sp. TaxID=1042 RepID=UPI0032F0517A
MDGPCERRGDNRVKSAYRPGCVLLPGRMVLGVIRNLSKGGAMIELDERIEPGTEVRYFWDETNIMDAVVAWADGRAHGLENAEHARPFDNPFPYRSVRVPCAMRAELWVGGQRRFADIENLSLGGVCLRGLAACRGALLTVKLGDVELCNATVRWVREGVAGVRFERPLTRGDLARILRGFGEEAALVEGIDAAHRE